ncbi:hypothetical protein TNCV_2900911 [Trichonephila clavipes]|nr:hypothetical protein TNCV_2900911 [Trichonephila clavipes]
MCVPTRLKHAVVYAAARFCREGAFLKRSVRITPLEQRGMSPKKEKDIRRQLKYIKMGNEFVCQFKPVYDNDSTILLTRSRRRGS